MQSHPTQYVYLYNNQINARAPIGQSAVGYCAGKPMEKLHVFWIIIYKQWTTSFYGLFNK